MNKAKQNQRAKREEMQEKQAQKVIKVIFYCLIGLAVASAIYMSLN